MLNLLKNPREVPVSVFINYRAEDGQTAAALIDRELAATCGSNNVFLDCRSIPAGVDFVEELWTRLRMARVLLAVIGPRWLTARTETGHRRLDDPRDWIRTEIAFALTNNLRVIPVLIDDAHLPREPDLPSNIAGLSRRQYIQLRPRYLSIDLRYLVECVTDAHPNQPAPPNQRGQDEPPQ